MFGLIPIGYISLQLNIPIIGPLGGTMMKMLNSFNLLEKTTSLSYQFSTTLTTAEKWTMLHHMSSSEYLNYEGKVFQKVKS